MTRKFEGPAEHPLQMKIQLRFEVSVYNSNLNHGAALHRYVCILTGKNERRFGGNVSPSSGFENPSHTFWTLETLGWRQHASPNVAITCHLTLRHVPEDINIQIMFVTDSIIYSLSWNTVCNVKTKWFSLQLKVLISPHSVIYLANFSSLMAVLLDLHEA